MCIKFIRRGQVICPTHVGMNRALVAVAQGFGLICPTHVGMNRHVT